MILYTNIRQYCLINKFKQYYIWHVIVKTKERWYSMNNIDILLRKFDYYYHSSFI